MGFSRQECWSGLPYPPPGDLSDPGIEPASPALQVDSLPLSCQEGSIFSYLDLNVRTICDPDFDGGKDKSGPFSGTSTLCLLLLFRNYVVSDSVTP